VGITVYCNRCGKEQREGARFCDSCGAELTIRKGPNPLVQTGSGEIYRSAGLLVSQQRLMISIIFAGSGLLMLLMAASIPPTSSTPFGPADDYTMRNMGMVMGIVLMLIGGAIFFLGNRLQARS
jgi:hypothetical protein